MNKSAYQQEPPFACQIELTEGCPLRCSMCGIQGIRDKPGDYKFMTPAIATKIAKDIAKVGWHARLEFAMHGEPSISPHRDEIISIFRTQLPNNQIMMTSNGAGFAKDPAKQIAGLFKAGVNILALDDYQGVPFVPKIRAALGADGYVDYPKGGLEFSPHRRWPISTHRVVIIEDINAATSGSHSNIVNHCGAGSPPNNSRMGQRCAKPFRELSIRWNGRIALCCDDWRGIYKIGSVVDTPIDVLWNNAAFNAARRKLYHGKRDFGACAGCDERTYRNGLLPDQRGKLKLPLPDKDDLAVIAAASAGPSLTQIVLRPWEVKK